MGDYEVGYGKPPKASQFKKGQSGNPNGRAKRVPSVAALLRRELNRRVTIAEKNGVEKEITLREAVARQIAMQAAKGDNKKIGFVLTMIPAMEALEAPVEVAGHADDQATLDNVLKWLQGTSSGLGDKP